MQGKGRTVPTALLQSILTGLSTASLVGLTHFCSSSYYVSGWVGGEGQGLPGVESAAFGNILRNFLMPQANLFAFPLGV